MGSGTQGSAPDNVSGTRLDSPVSRAAGWAGQRALTCPQAGGIHRGQAWTLREWADPAAFSHSQCFLVGQMF